MNIEKEKSQMKAVINSKNIDIIEVVTLSDDDESSRENISVHVAHPELFNWEKECENDIHASNSKSEEKKYSCDGINSVGSDDLDNNFDNPDNICCDSAASKTETENVFIFKQDKEKEELPGASSTDCVDNVQISTCDINKEDNNDNSSNLPKDADENKNSP